MNLLRIRAFIAFAFIIAFSAPSWADWQVSVVDDAFSGKNTVKLLGTLERNTGVMYECKGNDLVIHFLEKSDFSDYLKEGVTVGDLAIKVDNNEPFLFEDAHLYRHNHNFVSIRSYDKARIIESLKALKNAKIEVVAGVQMTSGTTLSRKGDFYDASKAVSNFARQCNIKL